MTDARGNGDRSSLTIEELGTATGMTVRNVRAHQSRGLLPPPKVIGRVGYYGAGHIERLHLIRQMQDEGFNLAAIASALAAGPDTATRLRELRRPALIELDVGPEAVLSEAGLEAISGALGGDLQLLIDGGLLRLLPDGRYAATTSGMLAAARRLRSLGVGFDHQARTLKETLGAARAAATGAATAAERLVAGTAEPTDEIRAAARTLVSEVYHQAFEHALDYALSGSEARQV